MKEKTKKRIRGSISIFLVIIMVPMMCLSGLIVDGSRVELGKAYVSGAGDLTMNSALANYDTILKDVYGLFAMSQTAGDLENNLYDYFVNTLMANGIITTEEDVKNNPLLQDIAGAFSGNTSNMLSMEVDKADFTATKLKDSSLANPYILKNQIVEYQKYRAPVSSALSLLDGIAAIKKILNQNNVNKAKTKVDEKSGDLNKKAKDLYDTLKNFLEKISPYEESSYYGFSYKDANSYKNAYVKYVMPEYVKRIVECMPYTIWMEKVENKDKNTVEYKFNFDDNYLDNTHGINEVEWKSYTGKETEELLNELIFAYERYEDTLIQEAKSYLIQKNDISTLNVKDRISYATAYTRYMQSVYNLKNFYDAYKRQYDVEKDDITFITEHEQEIIDSFENACVFSANLKNYLSKADSQVESADNALKAINEDLNQKIECFSEVDDILEEAIGKIEELRTVIDDLNNLNDDFKKKIDGYNGSDEPDSFSKQMQSDYEYYKENIDKDKLNALKSALGALRNYFKDTVKYLKSIKCAGLAGYHKDSKSLEKLVEKTSNKQVPGAQGENNSEYIKNKISTVTDLNAFYEKLISEGEKPASNKKKNIKANDFYKYLEQAYSVEATEEDKQAETLKNEINGAAKEADIDENVAPYNVVVIQDEIKNMLPSQGDFIPPDEVEGYDGSEKFSGLFERISAAVADLLEGIKKAATAGRDNLYVAQYVFDMFSYNTMEAEFKVENEGSTENNSKSLGGLGVSLETSSGVGKNAKNNYMYGAEIEYILYGGFNAEKNISTAKMNIFCIRFLANSAYALTNSEIRGITLPPALSVQAATLGVVPYKLTQVVLQLCLALGESVNDIRLMEQGKRVALIKSSDTWMLSVRGGLNAAKEAISNGIKNQTENVKGVVNDLIDAGAEKINVNIEDFASDITVAVNQQIEEILGTMFSAVEEEIIGSLDYYLKNGNKLVGNVSDIAQSIIDNADAKVIEIINGTGENIRPLLLTAYSSTLKPTLLGYKTEIQNALGQIQITTAGDILLEVQKRIADSLSGIVDDAVDVATAQTSNLVESLKNKLSVNSEKCIDMASDKILECTNDFFDGAMGSLDKKLPDMGGKASNSSALSSVIKFNYGDYLKMFLFLKLCVNDEEILSRIADVIQLNANYALADSGFTHPVKGKFLMSEAYTYIQIDADVKLKTMFVSLPFFTEYAGKGASYFNLKYKSVLGY